MASQLDFASLQISSSAAPQASFAVQSPADVMRDRSELINMQDKIYQLPIISDEKLKTTSKIARCFVGDKPPQALGVPEKVLMVVGATGAGKSTLINAIVNYILGVKWTDSYRFRLISEPPSANAGSVTKWITAYTMYYQYGSPVPYTLTIVDTPGFGDTAGLERDKEITKQIKEFFSIPPQEGGIDQIDGIGFVSQATLARLTHTQRYVFDSILSTFGKDISDNIFLMLTFADSNKPRVIEAIKSADIPYRKYFKFNNSALYPQLPDDIEEEEESDFNELFWIMGQKSLNRFFECFDEVKPKSLQLTKEVLLERERLEANVNGLQPQITEGLSKMDLMHKEQKILEEHENDIKNNKEFERTIWVPKHKRVDLQQGVYVTNCLTCNRSCHFPCKIAEDNEKYNCAAMDGNGSLKAKCTVCPGNCDWDRHVNNPYRFDTYKDKEVVTLDSLKVKYFAAKKGKAKKEDIIRAIKERLTLVDQLVMENIRQVQRSLSRLDLIALKPNPLSEIEYIDLLIESEKQEAKAGWNERVQYLQAAKKQAQVTAGIRSVKEEPTDRVTLWRRVKGWWSE